MKGLEFFLFFHSASSLFRPQHNERKQFYRGARKALRYVFNVGENIMKEKDRKPTEQDENNLLGGERGRYNRNFFWDRAPERHHFDGEQSSDESENRNDGGGDTVDLKRETSNDQEHRKPDLDTFPIVEQSSDKVSSINIVTEEGRKDDSINGKPYDVDDNKVDRQMKEIVVDNIPTPSIQNLGKDDDQIEPEKMEQNVSGKGIEEEQINLEENDKYDKTYEERDALIKNIINSRIQELYEVSGLQSHDALNNRYSVNKCNGCHTYAKCVREKCVCDSGTEGDGISKCQYIAPEIIDIIPRNLSAGSTIIILLSEKPHYSAPNIMCKFGQIEVTAIANGTTLVCALPLTARGKINTCVSLDGFQWSKTSQIDVFADFSKYKNIFRVMLSFSIGFVLIFSISHIYDHISSMRESNSNIFYA